MIILDRKGQAALIQTLDGKIAVKQVSQESASLLYATNHSILSEFSSLEDKAMVNSINRYETIKRCFSTSKNIASRQVKDLLLLKYPDGLCFHNFNQWFGTTKSIIISPVEGTIEICWGGRVENGWERYCINKI